MNWIYYLLEANLYLLVFYAFYRLFLSRETFYSLNRYYLLGSTLVAFLLPGMQAGFLFDLVPGFGHHGDGLTTALASDNPAIDYLSIGFIIPAVYLGVVALFFIRMLWNLSALFVLAFQAKRGIYNGLNFYELKGSEIAFSFFGFLFLNPAAGEKELIIQHEHVHIKQLHSLDTLFLELVQVLSWFNPVVYFLKGDLNTLHEFIADELTTANPTVQKHTYAMLLIQNSFGLPQHALTKPIYNQSTLKQRITMLNQPKTAAGARLRLLLVLPMLCAMICTSTLAFSKSYKLIDLYAGQQTENPEALQDTTKRIPPPPPPAEPKEVAKAPNQVRFPPPIVTRNKSVKSKGEVRFPLPAKPNKPAKAVVPATPPLAPKGLKGEVPPPPPPVEPVEPVEKN
jgi:hypothetical protein